MVKETYLSVSALERVWLINFLERKMKILFMAGVTGVNIDANLGDGIDVYRGMFVTNNVTRIKNLIKNDFREVIGKLEYEFLVQKGSVVMYSIEEVDKKEGFNRDKYTVNCLQKARFFLNFCWFIKDNSFDLETGFISFPYGIKKTAIHSNSISAQFSLTDGEKKQVTLTVDEINSVAKMCGKHDFAIETGEKMLTFSHKKFVRITRAMYFQSIARNTADLGLKIANYCTSFETLFATSTTELTHRLSERVAFFLGRTSEQRLQIYSDIKQAYGVRSSVVHGDAISSKQLPVLKEISQKVDGYLKQVLSVILNDKNIEELLIQSPEKIDQYFTKLLFGL